MIVTILPLKSTLLYWLHQAFLGDCEDEPSSFISFLQTDDLQGCFLRSCEPTISLLTNPIWQNIPLQKKQNEADVLYVSAMPQRLFQRHDSVSLLSALKGIKEPSKEISSQTVDRPKKNEFQSINCELDHKGDVRALLFQLWAEFQIETQRSGWIAFRLSNQGIGLWLDQLPRLLCDSNSGFSSSSLTSVDTPFRAAASSCSPTSSCSFVSSIKLKEAKAIESKVETKRDTSADAMLWQVQYTHARCCTLMRLWQSMHGELSKSSTLEVALEEVVTSFGMSTRVEIGLIHALIEATDSLFWIPYRWPSQQYFLLLKCAVQLCQAFDAFCSVRLSGFGQLAHVSTVASSTATAGEFWFGFYLTAATENILKVLLCVYLGAEAPAEL